MLVNRLVSLVVHPILAISALLAVSGCTHERLLASGRSYVLRIAAGDMQTGPLGNVLTQPLSVSVVDAAGNPVKAAVVVFRVTAGTSDGAAVLDSLSVTDATGTAQAELRLGTRSGAVTVLAFAPGAEDRAVTMRATAMGGPTISGVLPVNVGPGDTLAIAGDALGGVGATVEFGTTRARPVSGSNGELRVVVPDCLPAGSLSLRVLSGSAWTAPATLSYSSRRRPLTLRPLEAVTITATELASCAELTTSGSEAYLLIPQFAAYAESPVSTVVRISGGGTSAATVFGGAMSPAGMRGGPDAQWAIDRTLREQEQRLAPLARGGQAYRPPMLALTVGSLRTFRVITSQAADQFTNATGQLRYLGEHLGIYVDTSTASAYTDTEIERLGHLFDAELYHTVVEAFGPESDIDQNGKVLVFLTPRVNALVASLDCGARGFVTGFFYGRDLLPSLTNSNAGEIFYALVPDPTGRFSCSHSSYDTQRLVSSTFVHEMQHMISYFHHVVARGGDAEQHWVNEGLSHIAEELASKLFEARYPPPLNRTSSTQLFPDSAAPFITQQLMNAYVYLNSTPSHSVTTFDGTGSMEERGAAWMFLRWLGDQKGEAIYRRLVQTSLTGVANIEARSGEPFGQLFGDFALALWTDSIPGVARSQVAPRYRFLSRNLRQLMARQALISGWPDEWPVKPVNVPFGGYAEGSLIQGTMVYTSFGPFPAGTSAAVLGFGKSAGGAFGKAEGAQVGVLRVK